MDKACKALLLTFRKTGLWNRDKGYAIEQEKERILCAAKALYFMIYKGMTAAGNGRIRDDFFTERSTSAGTCAQQRSKIRRTVFFSF